MRDPDPANRRRREGSVCVAIGLRLVLAATAGYRGPVTIAKGKATLNLTSSSFQAGEIPKKFTCDDAETSPALTWTTPPAGTQSLALIVVDRDAPFGSFVHWVLYDMTAGKRAVVEGLSTLWTV